jgi:hypothetical protein
MAAKQIITLETNTADGGQISVRVAMWFPVTAGKELPRPDMLKSAWSGASAGEMTALQTGTVVEETRTFNFPNSYTVTQIKAALVAAYATRATYLATLPFQGQYYGIFYDGATWSA